MRTTCSVATGAEFLNDYGCLPRADLLRRYGYTNESYALYDVVEIPTSLLIEICIPSMSKSEGLTNCLPFRGRYPR